MPDSFKTFTHQELGRIQKNLRRRFRDPNIVGVAFGPGQIKGQPDPDRPFCICFFVTRKRKRENAKQGIPPNIKFRLKRAAKFQTFELPTDVIQSRKMSPSGRFVKRPSKRSKVTTGSVISWKEKGSTRRKWAVVTVGHYFPTDKLSKKPVTIHVTSTSKISGKLVLRSGIASHLDAAVIAIEKPKLVGARLIPSKWIPHLKPRSLEQLKGDIGTKGESLAPPRSTRVKIAFDHFFPWSDDIPELGKLKNVVRTTSKTHGAFKGGRSGTTFVSNRKQISSMQFGGTTGAAKIGLGQSYQSILEWIETKLKSKVDLVDGSLFLVSKF